MKDYEVERLPNLKLTQRRSYHYITYIMYLITEGQRDTELRLKYF